MAQNHRPTRANPRFSYIGLGLAIAGLQIPNIQWDQATQDEQIICWDAPNGEALIGQYFAIPRQHIREIAQAQSGCTKDQLNELMLNAPYLEG